MLLSIILSAAFAMLAIGLMRLTVERWAPAAQVPFGHGVLNILTIVSWFALNALIGPLLVWMVSTAANRAGGGWLVLPSHGWPMALGALLYVFVADAGEYAFHRLQHMSPWLWSIHSLHHSDQALDASTAGLNHWSAMIMRTAFVALPLGLMFKASEGVVLIYFASTFYVYFVHANARIDFGKASWLLSSPIYHRIHHSVEPQHYDRNFAFIFPIYDLVLGTYRPARAGECPATGLSTGDCPSDWIEVMAWPLRGPLRRWRYRGARAAA